MSNFIFLWQQFQKSYNKSELPNKKSPFFSTFFGVVLILTILPENTDGNRKLIEHDISLLKVHLIISM